MNPNHESEANVTKAEKHERRIEALCQRLADMLSGCCGADYQDFDQDLFDCGFVWTPNFGKWLQTIEINFFSPGGKIINTGRLFALDEFAEWQTIRQAAERVARFQDLLADELAEGESK